MQKIYRQFFTSAAANKAREVANVMSLLQEVVDVEFGDRTFIFCNMLGQARCSRGKGILTPLTSYLISSKTNEEIKSNNNLHTVDYSNYSFANFLHNIINNNSQNK